MRQEFAMRPTRFALICGLAPALLLMTPAQAQQPAGTPLKIVHTGLQFAPRSLETHKGLPHGHHLVALVGDRESGYGFYPPVHRLAPRGWRPAEPNAVRDALANQAVYGLNGIGGGVWGERHAHSMFNPVDGYGTPFFAGFYGPAGDPDAERGPLGNPYRD